MSEKVNIQERVKQYVQLRDGYDAAKKEFDAKTKRIKEAIAKLEAEFLDHLNKEGLKNIGADTGTVYKIPRYSVSVKDREEYLRYVFSTKNLEALDVRANKKVVKDLLEKGEEVPGIKYTESTQIGVRRGNTDE